ncbi:GNAT family N-acetyltransferase [Actinoplanes sp. TBRC 11911]|uniref:GNAT family N-acetyltransferase n=1 Tax=Actinoplanes sp. TBRC 11911 TaxID=2729386 RepID=UPI00145CC899|nr:GNAT family N-acetyltransferase [Actinoplanes sp. TBRC 11911]NMO50816.1 GNAT family N-acetyltransferase [Actinoplanes sp. TBRC 11911]
MTREDAWRLARDARLAALQDAPESLLPTDPHESTWNEDSWRRSFKTGLWVVARTDRMTVGLARLTEEAKGRPHVESVWTHPRHRRGRIASRLIQRLLHEVHDHDVFVWVLDPNPAAIRLYESLHFERTDVRQKLHPSGRVEEQLRLSAALLPS